MQAVYAIIIPNTHLNNFIFKNKNINKKPALRSTAARTGTPLREPIRLTAPNHK
jgi:hypothetical protein